MSPVITWVSHGMDRKSVDGRWHIRHPSTTPSKRWELYDMKASKWHGDWGTCAQAKDAAELRERRRGQEEK